MLLEQLLDPRGWEHKRAVQDAQGDGHWLSLSAGEVDRDAVALPRTSQDLGALGAAAENEGLRKVIKPARRLNLQCRPQT